MANTDVDANRRKWIAALEAADALAYVINATKRTLSPNDPGHEAICVALAAYLAARKGG